ncbi:MAG: SsrA-binding protein [Verrucomicrobiaceae bacterium]|nr:SsrA-binding protein [Verrucomicrobiaceae bacterium]
MNAKKEPQNNTIAQNKKARFDYHLDEKFEAGLALQGWEVKSLRAGKAQITDSYVLLKNGEAWLIGALITPLNTVSTHFVVDSTRTRKLLITRKQLDKLIARTHQKGYTCVCLSLYWKGHLIKAEIALAKGKQEHDKRETEKERDWNREKQRVVRHAQ